MAVYGYCRVSTTAQADEGESLDVQRRKIEGRAMQDGLHIDRMFIDRAVSGDRKLEERPQGRVLLATLRPGDTVIASKLDRLFRSARDALNTLEDLKDQGISLILLDMGGDVTGNGVAALVFTILSAVAQFERERIQERVLDIKADQRARNRYLGGLVPFGFRVTEDGDLAEDPAQQAAIADMQRWRAEGQTLMAISEALKERGITLSHVGVKKVLDRLSGRRKPAKKRARRAESRERA